MFGLDKGIKRALELRDQLTAAKFGRRELARLGLVASGASFAQGASLRAALAADVPAINLTPWVDELPVPGRLTPSSYSYDASAHQWCDRYYATPDNCYKLKVQEIAHKFHRDLPASKVWSYNDSFGGPVIDLRYGTPFCVNLENTLSRTHKGYGQPEVSAHLHNFHTATESDGGPWNWIPPSDNLQGKPHYRVQHYTAARAGFTSTPADFADPLAPGGTWWGKDGGDGDLRETLTTLFYHDHRPEFTGPNLYKGLFMMFRAFDQDDTGDETKGWRLPSGKYDVPLMFQDKQIVAGTGEMVFDQFSTDGFIGPYLTVNGKVKPFMNVQRRKYRFRLLDGGPSRFYRFVLRNGGQNRKFTQVTQSGNLLPRPKVVTTTDLWVAERSDIVVDFSQFKTGDVVYLCNTLSMRANGRGEEVGKVLNADDPANQLLKFVVGETVADPSRVPGAFRPLPPLPDLTNLPRKMFKFGRKNGEWTINDQFWDPDIDHEEFIAKNPPNQVTRDTAEIWTLDSSSGGWDHPMHIHFEEGQIIRQNGVAVPEASRFRTDIYRLRQNRLEFVMRFRDFPKDGYAGTKSTEAGNITDDAGRYVMHCHNVVHEDHAMMTTWSIRPPK